MEWDDTLKKKKKGKILLSMLGSLCVSPFLRDDMLITQGRGSMLCYNCIHDASLPSQPLHATLKYNNTSRHSYSQIPTSYYWSSNSFDTWFWTRISRAFEVVEKSEKWNHQDFYLTYLHKQLYEVYARYGPFNKSQMGRGLYIQWIA